MRERNKEIVEQAKPTKKVNRMLWGLSSDAWNIILVISLALTALATYATIQLSKDKDAVVDVKVADAKQEGIKAGQAAATAQTKTQELERRTAPRRIDRPKFLSILQGEPVGTVKIIYGEEATESFELSLDLLGVLRQGGWTVADHKSIPVKELHQHCIGEMLFFARSYSQDDWLEADKLAVGRTNPVKKPPRVTILAAIMATVGGGQMQSDPSLPEGLIRLIVCPR
jgi:hypothetical protein